MVTGVGAPRGIARTVARRPADDGWSLLVLDVDAAGVAQRAEQLAASGAEAVGVATDVTSPEDVAAAFTGADGALPPVMGLATLAGIASPTPLLEITLAEWDRVVAVNATGSLLLQEAGRRTVAAGGGRVVMTSSITALDGGGTFSRSGYAAAKAAVLGKGAMAAGIPAGRVGQPGDIAAVVAFLLSEGAGFVNGVSMNVDGGKHMH